VGQNVTVVGDNFFEGMQVFFGNNATYCEVLTPHAAKTVAPPRTTGGVVDISIGLKGRPCSKGPMGRFMYVLEPGKIRASVASAKNSSRVRLAEKLSLESGFNRLSKVLKMCAPGAATDHLEPRMTKETVLHRAADIMEGIVQQAGRWDYGRHYGGYHDVAAAAALSAVANNDYHRNNGNNNNGTASPRAYSDPATPGGENGGGGDSASAPGAPPHPDPVGTPATTAGATGYNGAETPPASDAAPTTPTQVGSNGSPPQTAGAGGGGNHQQFLSPSEFITCWPHLTRMNTKMAAIFLNTLMYIIVVCKFELFSRVLLKLHSFSVSIPPRIDPACSTHLQDPFLLFSKRRFEHSVTSGAIFRTTATATTSPPTATTQSPDAAGLGRWRLPPRQLPLSPAYGLTLQHSHSANT